MRSSIAPTTLLAGLELEEGHIGVNRRQETNLPGVYAAGDCTGKPYQYAKAVGEGNVAAHSIIVYLGE
jgi:thioredoxin reductase (NADPH)